MQCPTAWKCCIESLNPQNSSSHHTLSIWQSDALLDGLPCGSLLGIQLHTWNHMPMPLDTASSTFHSLSRVLFTIPSVYLCTIGLAAMISLSGVHQTILGCKFKQPYSQNRLSLAHQHISIAFGSFTLLRLAIPCWHWCRYDRAMNHSHPQQNQKKPSQLIFSGWTRELSSKPTSFAITAGFTVVFSSTHD